MRKWSIVSGVVGIVLIAGALVVAYALAPALVKLPGETNVTRTYSGTAAARRYAGRAARGGKHVDLFHSGTLPARVTDPRQLRTLPTSLPKSVIPTLATANGIPASALSAVQPFLPQLPANLPLAYTSQL